MRAKTILPLTAAVVSVFMSEPVTRAASYTGGSGASYALGDVANDVLLSPAVTLSSAADQSFVRGYSPVAISTITIRDDPVDPVIKSIKPVVVWIPSDFALIWDETDTIPVFGGTAAGKVSTLVSYAGSSQRLVITVTADFIAGDSLTVRALSFKNYIGFGSARLQLDYDNDGVIDTQDDKTITILGFYSFGGPGSSFSMNQMQDKCLLPVGTTLTTR